MTKKQLIVALDDGHGIETPGKRTPYISEIGRAIKENEFNREVVKFLKVELERHGFKVVLVAPTDKDDSLATRVQRANAAGASIYVSIHYDAFDGEFNGYDPEGLTVFYAPGSKNGKYLAECVHSFLKQGTPQKDRGVKPYAYYVLKNTKMPAILTENGFMDNKREALLMINEAFQREVAREHAQGVCKYFGITYIPERIPNPAPPIILPPIETEGIILNETGRREARELIKRAVKEDVFTSKHENVDNYSDSELISYVIAYVNRKLK